RRGGAGDVGAHRRAAATKAQTDVCRLWRQRRLGQTAPRPGRGRARGAVPRSRFRRNPKGAWVLLGSAIVRLAKIARPRMRAIAALLLLDDPHRDRLRRRALRSPHFHSRELEVRSLRNAARQYPCARPFVLSPRAARGLDPRRTGNDEWFRSAGLSFRYSSPNPAVPVALLPIPLRTGCTVPPALHGRACPPLHSSAVLLPA